MCVWNSVCAVSWSSGARQQTAHRQHYTSPLAASDRNLVEGAVPASEMMAAGESICFYRAVMLQAIAWLYEIAERVSEIISWEK